jgi:hypothetical protein
MATSVDITRIQNQTSSSAVGLKLNAFIQDFMQSTNKGLLTQNLYKDLGKNIPTTVKYLGEALDRRINKKSADQKIDDLALMLSQFFAGDHTKGLGTAIIKKMLSPDEKLGLGITPKAEIPMALKLIRSLSDRLQKPLADVVDVLKKQGVYIDQDNENILLEGKSKRSFKSNGSMEFTQKSDTKTGVYSGHQGFGLLINDATKIATARAQDKSEREENPKDIALEKIIAQVPLLIDNSKEFGINKMAQIVDKFAEYVG